MDKSDEAQFLLGCARVQISEAERQSIERLCASGLDWDWIVERALHNRLGPLVYRSLREMGLRKWVPPVAMRTLETSYYLALSHSTLGEQAVREVFLRFEREGIQTILLRGLALGETVYGDPALRPFSDLDLLIRKQDLPRAKEALLDLGYRFPPDGPDARYFERNHLHLQFLRGEAVIELHWALDHKYTVFDIDYAEIFAEAVSGKIAGVETLLMPPESLLLSLCVHLVKHCYYTRYILPRPDLAELVLASGFLILYCDIAELIRRHGPDLDWDLIVDKARHWQVESAVQPSLDAVAQLFRAPVRQGILASLPPPRTGWLEGRILAWAVEELEVEKVRSGPSHPLRNLWGLRTDLMFRPVRMLDLFQYLWPSASFIARRYRVSHPVQVGLCRGLHTGKVLGEGLANLADLVYYTRIKRRPYGRILT